MTCLYGKNLRGIIKKQNRNHKLLLFFVEIHLQAHYYCCRPVK